MSSTPQTPVTLFNKTRSQNKPENGRYFMISHFAKLLVTCKELTY